MNWADTQRDATSAALALRATSLSAAPEVFASGPRSLFSEMAMASMAGRAIRGTVSLAAREHVGATTRPRPASPPRLLGSPAGIAAELRELAELRDSGILTDEEFSEVKRRVLGR